MNRLAQNIDQININSVNLGTMQIETEQAQVNKWSRTKMVLQLNATKSIQRDKALQKLAVEGFH